MVEKPAQAEQILDRHGDNKNALIEILLDIQQQNGWLSKDALMQVGQKLDVPLSQIYHIATFYKAFSLIPKGRHLVSVCLGTACQVRGAPRLLDRVEESFKVKRGETSKDMRFSLDVVNCLGCCAIGPVMVVDGEYYSKPSAKEIEHIIAACD